MATSITVKRELYNNVITFRLTKAQLKKLRVTAEMYADGDISSWLRYLIETYTPRIVRPKRKKKARKAKT